MLGVSENQPVANAATCARYVHRSFVQAIHTLPPQLESFLDLGGHHALGDPFGVPFKSPCALVVKGTPSL